MSTVEAVGKTLSHLRFTEHGALPVFDFGQM